MVYVLYAVIALVVLAILGFLLSYLISRGEESKAHLKSEAAFENKVKKLRRQDALKKKHKHDLKPQK